MSEQAQRDVIEYAVAGQEVIVTVFNRGNLVERGCTVKEIITRGRVILTVNGTGGAFPFPHVNVLTPIVAARLGEAFDFAEIIMGRQRYPSLTDANSLIQLSRTPEGCTRAGELVERVFRDLTDARCAHRDECRRLIADFNLHLDALSMSVNPPTPSQATAVTMTLFRLYRIAAVEDKLLPKSVRDEAKRGEKWESFFRTELSLDRCIRNALEVCGLKHAHAYRIPSGEYPAQL